MWEFLKESDNTGMENVEDPNCNIPKPIASYNLL